MGLARVARLPNRIHERPARRAIEHLREGARRAAVMNVYVAPQRKPDGWISEFRKAGRLPNRSRSLFRWGALLRHAQTGAHSK